ncbi:MAG: beta-lactamase family protein, partial [Chloroflexi bacterium]|nr:beta-lactamase family protein [Chloroflexota bacterium]
MPNRSERADDRVTVDAERVRRIGEVLHRAWEEKQFGGAAWSIVIDGQVSAGGVVGSRSTEPLEKVTEDTLFDLASLTKPVSTATSVLFLSDRGEVLLSDEVRRYYPSAGDQWNGITLRHLLTHTSGLPQYAALYADHAGIDSIREGILGQEMKAGPGENYDYSCLGYIMLQNIVQAVSGQSLAEFARENIFEPLGMDSSRYCPPEEWLPRIASGGACPHRSRAVHGEVHDPLAWAAGGVSGNAGLFANVLDVGRWAAAILRGGTNGTYRLFSAATARLMLTNQVDPSVGGHTFGLFAVPNG